MKKPTILITTLMVLSAIILSACNGTALLTGSPVTIAKAQSDNPAKPVEARNATAPIDPGPLSAYETTLENIYTQVNPSVVNIHVVQQQTAIASPGLPFFNLPGLPGDSQSPQSPQYSQGLGSGFVWDQQGHIVTNNHVIDGADKVDVTFSDGTNVPAKVIGADPNSDLAVLQVNVPSDQLHPVQFADSTQVKVGQVVIAIGNPFGLQGTMTVGIISGLGRTLPAGADNQSGPSYSIPDIIQTDAAINPGNSGGILVDDQGQVVGVTAAIESPVRANSGIGFVIPSAIIQKVVPVLITTGHYDHTYIGLSGLGLTPDLAKAMNLQPGQRGALVEDIAPGGPAEKAGIRGGNRQITINGQDVKVGGDVIVAIDGSPVKSMDDLIAILTDQTQVGQKVTFSLLRGGKEINVDVTLTARPPETQQSSNSQSAGAGVWLGIQAIELTPEIDRSMQLPESQLGILIQQVENGSPADQAGLHGSDKTVTINGQQILVGGDIITALDGQDITSIDDLHAFLLQSQPGQIVTMTILRDGKTLQMPITLAEHP